ncbi:MAG TPA: ABC transporter permease [Gemmatimonadales bacterium]|nr:ABC transporter permease [Gemmatimonadales bacterium]
MAKLVRPALKQLVLCRLREFYREPEALFWVYGFPILMATGLGIAFRNQPPKQVPLGWAAWEQSASDVRTALEQDSSLIVTAYPDSTAAAAALRIGKIDLLVIPGEHGVTYRFDDTRPEAAAARLHVDDAVQRARGRQDPLATDNEIVRDRGSRYIDFLLPGLLAMNLMGSGIWGSGFVIVNARKTRLLKRMVATPMSRADYLGSFLVAQLGLLVFEVGTLLLFGILAFDVPLRGSFIVFSSLVLLGSLAFGGLGLLVAARPRTVEGASGLMNLVMLPMWVLSGVFFSSARFPDVAQPFIKALPLTALADGMRKVMLEGAGFAGISGEMLVLAVWWVLSFTVALRIFRWQ